MSRTSQAHSHPNPNALHHLRINCTHLHILSPHQPAYKSTHLTPVQCPISFVRSGRMLLQLVFTCLLTLLSYLPPISSPACSSQLYSIVCVSQDLHECVSIVQDCEGVLHSPCPRVPVKTKEHLSSSSS